MHTITEDQNELLEVLKACRQFIGDLPVELHGYLLCVRDDKAIAKFEGKEVSRD
jgi:hypothetical protein